MGKAVNGRKAWTKEQVGFLLPLIDTFLDDRGYLTNARELANVHAAYIVKFGRTHPRTKAAVRVKANELAKTRGAEHLRRIEPLMPGAKVDARPATLQDRLQDFASQASAERFTISVEVRKSALDEIRAAAFSVSMKPEQYLIQLHEIAMGRA